MKTVLVFIVSFMTVASCAQQKITPEEAKDHINDNVEVNGKVSEIIYLPGVKNKPTIINVGGKSPKQLLSIVIFGDVRNKLGYDPQEEKYAQGGVTAKGKLELVRGKPQIVIKDPKQLGFIYDEEVPASQIPPIEKKNN